jgi:hypothetical protein
MRASAVPCPRRFLLASGPHPGPIDPPADGPPGVRLQRLQKSEAGKSADSVAGDRQSGCGVGERLRFSGTALKGLGRMAV